MKTIALLSSGFVFVGCALFSQLASAQSRYLLTPIEESAKLPHPLYGQNPNVRQEDYFVTKEIGDLAASIRITGDSTVSTPFTGITLLIKNLDVEKTLTIRPVLDLIDGSGLVLNVLNLPKLIQAAKAQSSVPTQSSFFAYGDQRFVASAIGGYAIASLLSAMASSSSNARNAKAAQIIQQHLCSFSDFGTKIQARNERLRSAAGACRWSEAYEPTRISTIYRGAEA